jgi:flagellar biosynthetic protein FlhB
MADQKTEQPTPRRLEKARKEGRFAVSREFVSGLQFLTFVAILVAYASQWAGAGRELMRALLLAAFSTELTRESFLHLLTGVIGPKFTPLLFAGSALTLVSLAVHLAITKVGFAPGKLMPEFSRLNPVPRLKGMPQQNLHSAMEAAVMLPVFIFALWIIVRDNLDAYLRLPLQSVESGLSRVADSFESLFWKAGGLFWVFGCLDLLRQKRRYTNELRMTKQEIREEHKESEGNPQIKAHIRRIRRDLLRRQMIRQVPTATAVVVNPTHFAVAVRYEMGSLNAPVCVAKGKNYLALRIKQIAIDNQVPIVENPPLAQALYKSVDVGQEIPAHLYRAVAEILAYIYRLMNR